VNVGETRCLVDNWMRKIFALVFVGGVDSAMKPDNGWTGYIEKYRNEINDKGNCEDFAIDLRGHQDAKGRKYFRCPVNGGGFDVVVLSDDCLFQFRFWSRAENSVHSSKPKLPLRLATCLTEKKHAINGVKAEKIDLDNGYATLTCEQERFHHWLLGKYTFKLNGVSTSVSNDKANLLCASFYNMRELTKNVLRAQGYQANYYRLYQSATADGSPIVAE
jgi:hypothetical protein